MRFNITTHSTGARVSWSFIENLNLSGLNARPVNSGAMRPIGILNHHEKEGEKKH
jgi:hypothetical protein